MSQRLRPSTANCLTVAASRRATLSLGTAERVRAGHWALMAPHQPGQSDPLRYPSLAESNPCKFRLLLARRFLRSPTLILLRPPEAVEVPFPHWQLQDAPQKGVHVDCPT